MGYPNYTIPRGQTAELVCDYRGTFPMDVYFWKTGNPWLEPIPPYVNGTCWI